MCCQSYKSLCQKLWKGPLILRQCKEAFVQQRNFTARYSSPEKRSFLWIPKHFLALENVNDLLHIDITSFLKHLNGIFKQRRGRKAFLTNLKQFSGAYREQAQWTFFVIEVSHMESCVMELTDTWGTKVCLCSKSRLYKRLISKILSYGDYFSWTQP